LYRETKDTLFSVEKARSIANLEAKVEVEKKEKEIELLNKTTELLEKDKVLQTVELERQKNAKIAIEKQAEADRLFALAQQEHDQRKQDSLRTLAQKNQLEAEKLKIENQHRELETQKAQDTQKFYLIITYLVGVLLLVSLSFLWFSWRNRRKLQKANNSLTLANNIVETQKTEILYTLALVEQQRNEIQTKNEDVIASIKYAKRIQTVLLPKVEKLQSYFSALLLFYQPKDIVSGDFYWFAKNPNDPSILLAVADCTGHGVPGAFMTVIGENLLDQIINKDKITSPAQILENLDERLSQILQHQDIANEAINDGMDISILHYDKECGLLVWAGAKRPLWIFEAGKNIPTEYKGNRFPVGSTQFKQKDFVETTIQLNSGDIIYAFTDGYADQFGTEGKFTIKKFRNLLQDIHLQDFNEQAKSLQKSLQTWKGQEEQTDDILVVGIRAD
jgi:serine phosphatase RsbU (regulator of sigma subunit)